MVSNASAVLSSDSILRSSKFNIQLGGGEIRSELASKKEKNCKSFAQSLILKNVYHFYYCVQDLNLIHCLLIFSTANMT